jgi:hypothetical protein
VIFESQKMQNFSLFLQKMKEISSLENKSRVHEQKVLYIEGGKV